MLLRTIINNQSIVIATLVPTSQWAKVRSSGFLSHWISIQQLLHILIIIQLNFSTYAQCASGYFLAYRA